MGENTFQITIGDNVKITREQYRALKTADKASIEAILSGIYKQGLESRQRAAETAKIY